MNLLDHFVTEIIGKPYYHDYGSGNFKWWVKVKATCYGHETKNTLMFNTKEEADSVKIGYKFLS